MNQAKRTVVILLVLGLVAMTGSFFANAGSLEAQLGLQKLKENVNELKDFLEAPEKFDIKGPTEAQTLEVGPPGVQYDYGDPGTVEYDYKVKKDGEVLQEGTGEFSLTEVAGDGEAKGDAEIPFNWDDLGAPSYGFDLPATFSLPGFHAQLEPGKNTFQVDFPPLEVTVKPSDLFEQSQIEIVGRQATGKDTSGNKVVVTLKDHIISLVPTVPKVTFPKSYASGKVAGLTLYPVIQEKEKKVVEKKNLMDFLDVKKDERPEVTFKWENELSWLFYKLDNPETPEIYEGDLVEPTAYNLEGTFEINKEGKVEVKKDSLEGEAVFMWPGLGLATEQ